VSEVLRQFFTSNVTLCNVMQTEGYQDRWTHPLSRQGSYSQLRWGKIDRRWVTKQGNWECSWTVPGGPGWRTSTQRAAAAEASAARADRTGEMWSHHQVGGGSLGWLQSAQYMALHIHQRTPSPHPVTQKPLL